MWSKRQFPAELVTFTEEIFNGKLHFLCSDQDESKTYWCSQFITNKIKLEVNEEPWYNEQN